MREPSLSFSGSVEVGEEGFVGPPRRAIRPPSSRSWASSGSVVEIRKGLVVGEVPRAEDVETM